MLNISKKMIVLLLPTILAVGCIEGNGKGGNGYNRNPFGAGPAGVSLSTDGQIVVAPGDLGSAGSYVIMGKSGISDTSGSVIVGNLAVSPAAASYITNFPLSMDVSGEYSTAPLVTGNFYASDYAVPTPNNLTVAIGNMQTAYTDAAGRTHPDFTEYGAGDIGGATLVPGLYKWGTGVIIPTTVYIKGSATDVWIFQIAQDLIMSAAMNVILQDGAKAENIFWQVAGQVTIGTTSHFEGIILSKTAVTLQTNATMNGRIYAQTLVSLDSSDVTEP